MIPDYLVSLHKTTGFSSNFSFLIPPFFSFHFMQPLLLVSLLSQF